MKHLIIIALILSSCSADWHVRRAIFKQPNILQSDNDTIRMTDIRLDTIFYEDTFRLFQTITERDTVIQTRYLAPETRYKIKYKYKTIKDTVKIAAKERIKVVKAEAKKSNWWIFLIIGFVIGFIIRYI